MRGKKKIVKKGVTAQQLSVLSECLLNFVNDYCGSKDSLEACACECLAQVKIKCDKTLASGIVKERYLLKLSLAEKHALVYVNRFSMFQVDPEINNALVLLLKSV
jgi:hypothetical protein